MALVATVAAADANSYCTVDQADTYFEHHLAGSSWSQLAPSRKADLLIHATRQIDRLRFWGVPCSATQALQWPRAYRCVWTCTAIPRSVIEATCEQALHLSQHCDSNGQSSRQALQAEGVRSFSAGDLTESFSSVATGAEAQICSTSRAILAPAIRRTGQVVRPHGHGSPCCDGHGCLQCQL